MVGGWVGSYRLGVGTYNVHVHGEAICMYNGYTRKPRIIKNGGWVGGYLHGDGRLLRRIRYVSLVHVNVSMYILE